MWNNVNVSSTYGQSERNRIKAKQSIAQRNFLLGLIFLPVWVAGWFPILWLVSKVVK